MNAHIFRFSGETLHALPSGALHIPAHDLLCVSDLHLGKSDRIARVSGTLIPPYENRATLDKLAQDISLTTPQTVICLGDSFDDSVAATTIPDEDRATISRLQAGRRWVWIAGNHDPGPVNLAGTHLATFALGEIAFRHITTAETPEISGHYHPKHGLPKTGRRRPCFIYNQARIILPAYGAYTGGLDAQSPAIKSLFSHTAIAVLTGTKAIAIPLSLPESRQSLHSNPLKHIKNID